MADRDASRAMLLKRLDEAKSAASTIRSENDVLLAYGEALVQKFKMLADSRRSDIQAS